MSKPIRSYPEQQRETVVARRLRSSVPGLGRQAALDYMFKVHAKDVRAEEAAMASKTFKRG